MRSPQTVAPVAEVVRVYAKRVRVRCPYCGETHEHDVGGFGQIERRAPGCGITRSAAQRAAGYTFTAPKKENHR